MSRETQHPAGHLVLTAATACCVPIPHPRRGRARTAWERVSALGKSSSVCTLSLLQAQSNCLVVASEAEATRPCHTYVQRGHPGGLSCGVGAEPHGYQLALSPASQGIGVDQCRSTTDAASGAVLHLQRWLSPSHAPHHGSRRTSDASTTTRGKEGDTGVLAYPWQTLA